MSIGHNIENIKSSIPKDILLVCVSKYKPASAIQEAYDIGQRVFGESKVQELVSKYEDLPKDIKWHFIGHLQTNKVKHIVPFVELIHGVDSIKLFLEINKQASKIGRKVNCLLQIHIAKESSKFGFSEKELVDFLNSNMYKELNHVTICGLMGMATNTTDNEQRRDEFKSLKGVFDNLKSTVFTFNPLFKELSIGMSGDYPIAIEEGSTMVRIGSAIFGERIY